jgi:two-component system chemotaxis response regulator CheY
MSPTAKVPHDHRSTVCLLVADADDHMRSLYRESLWLAGCQVVDAADGRDGLVKALVHPPTVVIIVTRLPFFDGHALCELLRRDSTTRTVLILVVTTETGLAELDRARAAGADAVLVKPVSPDALLNEIQRLLARSRTLHSESATHKAHPPELLCPSCAGWLTYAYSHMGGVSDRHREQWDYFVCSASCGTFQYRQRTRKLRRVADLVPDRRS